MLPSLSSVLLLLWTEGDIICDNENIDVEEGGVTGGSTPIPNRSMVRSTTLTFPSPTEQYTRMEHEEWLSAHDDMCIGGNASISKEEYDRLARITTHLESELKKYADSVGKIDPLMFAHYLVHHRSPRALAKAQSGGER